MFLCKPCHGKEGWEWCSMWLSRGRCESCGKAADCADCHNSTHGSKAQ